MITRDDLRALPQALLDTKDTTAIAAALPPHSRIESRPIGIGTVLAVMAPYGGAFLNALEAMSATDGNVKWTLRLIEKSDFDVGMSVTRTQLQAFADAQPALADGITALLSVAEVVEPVTEYEVRRLCWTDAGEWIFDSEMPSTEGEAP